MINLSMLLLLRGVERNRRDEIIDSKSVRHVVKIGPLHLKGVWVPYSRALQIALEVNILNTIQSLFVHDIGGLLLEKATRAVAVDQAPPQHPHPHPHLQESQEEQDSPDGSDGYLIQAFRSLEDLAVAIDVAKRAGLDPQELEPGKSFYVFNTQKAKDHLGSQRGYDEPQLVDEYQMQLILLEKATRKQKKSSAEPASPKPGTLAEL